MRTGDGDHRRLRFRFYLASAPIAQDAGIPYLVTGGTVPNLPEQIGEFAHMMPFGDDYQAYVAAGFALRIWAPRRVPAADSDTDYTNALPTSSPNVSESRRQGHRGEQLPHQRHRLFSHITKIRGTDPAPDFIYAAMNPGDDATFVRQAREAGVKIPIIGGDAFDNADLVKNAGANNTADVYFTTHMALTNDNPVVAKFIEAYQVEYGIPPENAFAGLGYVSVNLMVEAMNRPPTSAQSVNDAIFTIPPRLRHPMRTSPAGAGQGSDVIAVKDGKFVPIGNRKPST
jgi:branched-chain amino acid transport system substrate-binding protein